MLRRMLCIKQEDMLPQLDATDAVGAAMCHYLQSNRPQQEKAYSSWKRLFVEKILPKFIDKKQCLIV